MVAIRRSAQAPVTIPPMGAIRMCVPGTTNGSPAATTRVCMAPATLDSVTASSCCAKTPLTKVASLVERLVLTVWPWESTAVNLTTGTRDCCIVELGLLALDFVGRNGPTCCRSTRPGSPGQRMRRSGSMSGSASVSSPIRCVVMGWKRGDLLDALTRNY
jgi:hypothetical protein